MFKTKPTIALLNEMSAQTMVSACGIVFTEVGDDYLRATMPVDARTVQPMRILHGGASVVLAETLGSTAAMLCVDDPNTQTVVGVEINANHLRSAQEGSTVTGTVRAVNVGRRMQVWNTEIHDERGKLLCTSRLTVMVVAR